MLVSEHKCTINVRDSLIIAKFNDLFFFEFSVDGNIERGGVIGQINSCTK